MRTRAVSRWPSCSVSRRALCVFAGQPPQEIEQALWAVDDDVSRVEQRCRRLG